jgi:hypothetical protein
VDNDIRTLARVAEAGTRADRIRYRRAVERSGSGARAGLRALDVVKIRSCLVVNGITIEHFGVVRPRLKGTTDVAPPRLWKCDEKGKLVLGWDKWPTDVTGCPMCTVVLVEDVRGERWKRPAKDES